MCKTEKSYEKPIAVTLFIIAIGLIIFLRSEEPVTIADGAQYWASIVSACALVWLVLGYVQQNKSIDAQNRSIDAQNESIEVQKKQIVLYKKELKNQSAELELQRLELKKMSYSSTLMHIKEMMDTAMMEFDVHQYRNKVSYLNDDIKIIFESTNPTHVKDHVMNWFNEYGSYMKFSNRVRSAAEFFFRMNNIDYNSDYEYTDVFLFVNSPHFSKVPYLSEAYNLIAGNVALNTGTHDLPALAQVAMFSAQYLTNPRMVKIDALDKSAAKHEPEQLPAIFFEYQKAKAEAEGDG